MPVYYNISGHCIDNTILWAALAWLTVQRLTCVTGCDGRALSGDSGVRCLKRSAEGAHDFLVIRRNCSARHSAYCSDCSCNMFGLRLGCDQHHSALESNGNPNRHLESASASPEAISRTCAKSTVVHKYLSPRKACPGRTRSMICLFRGCVAELLQQGGQRDLNEEQRGPLMKALGPGAPDLLPTPGGTHGNKCAYGQAFRLEPASTPPRGMPFDC